MEENEDIVKMTNIIDEMGKEIVEMKVFMNVLEEKLKGSIDISMQYRALTEIQLVKAASELGRRLDTMNEFRVQLDRQASTFVTRTDIETVKTWIDLALKQTVEKYEEMIRAGQTRLEKLEVDKGKMEGKIWGIGIIWTVLLILLSWYLNSHALIPQR